MSSFCDFVAGVFGRKSKPAVCGSQGKLSYAITLPSDFNPEKDHCPMVILMHGFCSSKNFPPIPQLAKALAEEGIASIRFDFNAHGRSQGKFINMTIAGEIEDARAVYDYVCTLPYVTKIGLMGHSQGGVIAGMLAGELEGTASKPACIVQLAPAAVLKDDAIAGQCMGKKYDASNPPEYVTVLFHKLGRNFILAAQKLPVYETSCKYTGNVCLIHGRKDDIVPYSYSEKYHEVYPNSELHLLEDETHFMKKKLPEITAIAIEFLKKNLNSSTDIKN